MKRITAFVGSARKAHTHEAVAQFLQNLASMEDIEHEIVRLSDYDIGACRGCKLCMDKGEELCPLKDDRDVLIEKIAASDGIIMASPNYSFHLSGTMKTFLDRLGFAFHRPRFFGKAFTGIVAQGIYGGRNIVKYLNFIGNALGFNTVKGSCIQTLEPIAEKARKTIDRTLLAHAERFHKKLHEPPLPAPRLVNLAAFRMSRTSMRLILDDRYRDYRYYAENGWFDSDYYYPAPLGLPKRAVGWLFDSIAASMAGNR